MNISHKNNQRVSSAKRTFAIVMVLAMVCTSLSATQVFGDLPVGDLPENEVFIVYGDVVGILGEPVQNATIIATDITLEANLTENVWNGTYLVNLTEMGSQYGDIIFLEVTDGFYVANATFALELTETIVNFTLEQPELPEPSPPEITMPEFDYESPEYPPYLPGDEIDGDISPDHRITLPDELVAPPLPPMPSAPDERPSEVVYNITLLDVHSPIGILHQGKMAPLQFILINNGASTTTVTVDVSVLQPDGSEIFLRTFNYNIPSGMDMKRTLTWEPEQGGENTIIIKMNYEENGVPIENVEEVGFYVLHGTLDWGGGHVVSGTETYPPDDYTGPDPYEIYLYEVNDQGDLIIELGGTLIFRENQYGCRAVLIIDGYNWIDPANPFGIDIQKGVTSQGVFEIHDGSEVYAISSFPPSNRYQFDVHGSLTIDSHSMVKWMHGDDSDPMNPGGIHLHPGSTCTLSDGAIVSHGQTHNIFVEGNAALTVKDSNVTFAGQGGAGHGIFVDAHSNPKIEGCNITSNEDCGVYLDVSGTFTDATGSPSVTLEFLSGGQDIVELAIPKDSTIVSSSVTVTGETKVLTDSDMMYPGSLYNIMISGEDALWAGDVGSVQLYAGIPNEGVAYSDVWSHPKTVQNAMWDGGVFNYQWVYSAPWNPKLDVGADGTFEWTYTGELTSTEIVSGYTQEMQDHMDTTPAGPDGNVLVPLIFHSDSPGTLEVAEFSVIWKFDRIIKNNTIDQNYEGLHVQSSSPHIENNTIRNNSYGITIDNDYLNLDTRPLILDNNITENYVGVWAENSVPTVQKCDLISINMYGVVCVNNSDAMILENNITSNIEVGVYINGSSPDIIQNNISATTTYYGDFGSTSTSFGLVDRREAEARTSTMIMMKSARFDTLDGEPEVSQELYIENYSPSISGYYILQFSGPIETDWIQELEGAGIDFVDYVPNYAYVVTMDDIQKGYAETRDYVGWIGIYQPSYKLSPSAISNEGEITNITVQMVTTQSVEILISDITGLSDEVYEQWEMGKYSVLSVRIEAIHIPTIANMMDVMIIEDYLVPELTDEVASEIVGGAWPGVPGSYVNSLGYDGSGVIISVADTGIDDGDPTTMHPDLTDRVNAFIDYTESDTSDGIGEDPWGHGTHCAGIIAGDGASGRKDKKGYLYGMGVAPEAELVNQRIFDDNGRWRGPSLPNLVLDAINNGAVIGSNSWGAETRSTYTYRDAIIDMLARDADPETEGNQEYIMVFAAGNEGPDTGTIRSPGNAKNVITVGASENYRPSESPEADNLNAIAEFSSRGPTEYARIKPDIVAPGTWISSALSSSAQPGWYQNIDDLYEYCSGTSMACPTVAGGAALFVQYYRSLFGVDPSPAMVKAALINGAVNMKDDSGTEPVPNFDEGWGRMNLVNVLDPDEDMLYSDQEQENYLETGDVKEIPFHVGNYNPIRVSLVWNDPPSIASDIDLVNNLDLELVAPDGTVYTGNQFTHGWSDPSLMITDIFNNVENVFINPLFVQIGEYTVRIKADNIAVDNVENTVEIDQDFALVVRFSKNTGWGIAQFDREAYKEVDHAEITVTDYDLNTNPFIVEQSWAEVANPRTSETHALATLRS